MTNLKIWEIIQHPYLSSEDIKKISGIGINKAQQIRKEIAQECADYLLPRWKVPTDKVLKKLNIDRKKIFQNAKMERELI